MDTIKLKTGDKVVCPHCNETYGEDEGLVEDFVVPRKIGHESRADEQCVFCDEWFSVIKTGQDEFEVEPTKGD